MLIILFFLQNAFADAPQTLTLNQSYQLAIRKSEDVATQDENRAIASERVSQSKGALMPSIVGSALFARQDSPGAGASATASNISPETQSTIKIGAVQPLFRGLKEFAALRQSNRYLEAGELNQEQARIQLYSAVIQNFYQVLFLTKDLQNLLTEIDVNQKRLKELNDFRKIGRSRASEVLMLQANIASIDVQEEVLRPDHRSGSPRADPQRAPPGQQVRVAGELPLRGAGSRTDDAQGRHRLAVVDAQVDRRNRHHHPARHPAGPADLLSAPGTRPHVRPGPHGDQRTR